MKTYWLQSPSDRPAVRRRFFPFRLGHPGSDSEPPRRLKLSRKLSACCFPLQDDDQPYQPVSNTFEERFADEMTDIVRTTTFAHSIENGNCHSIENGNCNEGFLNGNAKVVHVASTSHVPDILIQSEPTQNSATNLTVSNLSICDSVISDGPEGAAAEPLWLSTASALRHSFNHHTQRTNSTAGPEPSVNVFMQSSLAHRSLGDHSHRKSVKW